jgi:integrase
MSKKKLPYNDRKGYAYVYVNRKPTPLKAPDGSRYRSGTPEALAAYHRFCVELQSNSTEYIAQTGRSDVTVSELGAAFLEHLKERTHEINYITFRIIIDEFLLALYWDTPVDAFSTTCLDLVRSAMKESGRFNRNVLNRHTRRIISIFKWGVWKELCKESTWRKLTVIPPYKKGEPGTFEGTKRKPVPDDVLLRTLPYLPPTVQSMVKVQRLTGARPGEICKLTVGAVDLKEGTILLTEHKTKEHVGERIIALRPEAREILAPYLIGKKPDNAVFSPRQAMEERNAERKKNRKSKITPSQAERDRQREKNPQSKVGEFYDSKSYYRAIKHGIAKGNKNGANIPHWYPYMNRHATATADAMESILKMAMERLGHTDTKMTEN